MKIIFFNEKSDFLLKKYNQTYFKFSCQQFVTPTCISLPVYIFLARQCLLVTTKHLFLQFIQLDADLHIGGTSNLTEFSFGVGFMITALAIVSQRQRILPQIDMSNSCYENSRVWGQQTLHSKGPKAQHLSLPFTLFPPFFEKKKKHKYKSFKKCSQDTCYTKSYNYNNLH